MSCSGPCQQAREELKLKTVSKNKECFGATEDIILFKSGCSYIIMETNEMTNHSIPKVISDYSIRTQSRLFYGCFNRSKKFE